MTIAMGLQSATDYKVIQYRYQLITLIFNSVFFNAACHTNPGGERNFTGGK